MVALYMQRYHMLYRHVNVLLACCRATTLFRMNLSCWQGLQVHLLRRFFLFASSACQGQGAARSVGLWFGHLHLLLLMGTAASLGAGGGVFFGGRPGLRTVGNLGGEEVGESLQHLSAFKESVMVLPPITHSKQ